MNHKITKAYQDMKTSTEGGQSLLTKTQHKFTKDHAAYSNQTNYASSQNLDLLSTTILCDLVTDLLTLKTGAENKDLNINYSLEIFQDENLTVVDKVINNNIVPVRKNIDNALSQIIHGDDLTTILEVLENTNERDIIVPIYERLYSYYISQSSTSNPEDKNTHLLNKCIKMLLECEVKGTHKKANIANV